MLVVTRPAVGVSEFTVTNLEIPPLICETKQGYRTEEAAQTRFNKSTQHTQRDHAIIVRACVCVFV